jgi:hypothetical protein
MFWKCLKDKVICFYDQGSTNTFLSSVRMLPPTKTAIVILTNLLSNNDTADWLKQLLLQAVLDALAEDQDLYLTLARESAARSTELWLDMADQRQRERVEGMKPRNLEEYTGRYFNVVNTYHIAVLLESDKFRKCFQAVCKSALRSRALSLQRLLIAVDVGWESSQRKIPCHERSFLFVSLGYVCSKWRDR